MADLAKHLPLSQRRDGDESGVSGDRRAEIAALLDAAAMLLARSPLDRDGRAAAAERLLSRARLGEIGADPATAAASVRDGRRRRVPDLARTVAALLALGDEIAAAVTLDPAVTGAVALYAATRAPFDRRAAIRGHTVRASDEDWSFGRGPVVEAPARDILRFLLGLSDRAPRRPADPADGTATVDA